MRATLVNLRLTPAGQFWFHVACVATEGREFRGLFGLIRRFPRSDTYEPNTKRIVWKVHVLGKTIRIGFKPGEE